MTSLRAGRGAVLVAAAATLFALAPSAPATAEGREVTVVLTLRQPSRAAAVATYLTRHGFTVTGNDGHTMAARGPLSTARTIKGSLENDVRYVAGLGTQHHWRHNAIPGGHTGESLASAYDLVAGDGTGLDIATVQFSGWDSGDLTTYAAAAGVATPSVTEITVGGGDPHDTSGGGAFEVALDQEALLATAPKANQRIYFAANTSADAALLYGRIATDAEGGLVDVVSTSWGMCEAFANEDPDNRASIEAALARIVAAGATVVGATGDYGAYDCSDPSVPANSLAVDFPAVSPNVVAVGGTSLAGSAGAWTETAWNQPQSGSFKGYAGGGGQSSSVHRPSWQSGIPLAGTNRLLPDVAAAADPNHGFGTYAVSAGGWVLGGGTSASAPITAGQLAAVLSAQGRTTGVGDIHDELYANPEAFRDITSGNNLYYPATAGYDLATGLGAPQWSALSAALFGNPVVTAPTATNDLTVPVDVTPVAGMTVTAWTTGEGVSVACDPSNSPVTPTSVALDPGGPDRLTRVAVAALDDHGACHVASAPVTLDTHAPAATGSIKAYAADARTVFTWGATDPGPSSGGLKYDVCVYAVGYGCTWTITATPAKTATLVLAQGRTYVLRVTPRDAAGNVGPQLQTGSYAVPVDDKSFSRTRGWRTGYSRSDWYNSHTGSSVKGAYQTRALAGTRYELFYVAHTAGGVMDVYINGTLVKRVNTYSGVRVYRKLITLATYSTRATRTVKIVVRGTRDTRSRGYDVSVDSLRVTF